MSIIIEQLGVDQQVEHITRLTDELITVIRNNGGSMDKREAKLIVAKNNRMSVSQMGIVVSSARSEKLLNCDSERSTLTIPA